MNQHKKYRRSRALYCSSDHLKNVTPLKSCLKSQANSLKTPYVATHSNQITNLKQTKIEFFNVEKMFEKNLQHRKSFCCKFRVFQNNLFISDSVYRLLFQYSKRKQAYDSYHIWWFLGGPLRCVNASYPIISNKFTVLIVQKTVSWIFKYFQKLS
jgi:hypothetical protein